MMRMPVWARLPNQKRPERVEFRSRLLVLGVLITAAFFSMAVAQPVPSVPAQARAVLRVSGAVDHPLVLGMSDLDAMHHVSANVDKNGVKAVYKGVPLFEILSRAGIPAGTPPRDTRNTLYVTVTAADGYRVVFALAELDPGFSDRTVLLADRRDDQPLASREGPFRIIVPGEKLHARWVREVQSLDLERAK
jgi:DMSO/TMAO reductase YedYZ molybdopterin-dependent catalytic subunit